MAGYLSTLGNQIVDEAGNSVKLNGVNWFGMESTRFAPDGLHVRNYKEMLKQMVDLGFNTIRLPFSNQLFDSTSFPNGINYTENPDLVGLTGLQIIDRIVAYAGQVGLKIILDHHRNYAGDGANLNGLWYDGLYDEQRWLSDWTMLANRYAGNPTIIGADLHNEPHGAATWGGGGANDWAAAAERAGNAVLAENPEWLIFVEGVESYQGHHYWWGGNLMGVKDRPIHLNIPGRVVYSPHDYPNSVFAQPWFSDASGSTLPSKFDEMWGYIFRENSAPVYLGEFGSTFTDPKDSVWFEKIRAYLSGDFDASGTTDMAPDREGIHWTWWSWNPNSGDTGGILTEDWTTVYQSKVNRLAPIMWSGDNPLIFVGSAGSDQLYSGERSSILNGLYGDDLLQGGSSQDTLEGGPGNDYIDGGSNTDTAVFSGKRSAYTILAQSDGKLQISDDRTSGDGVDIVSNIEILRFADASILLPSQPIQVLNAVPDQIIQEDHSWYFEIPSSTFAGGDGSISYAVTLANGSPLPSWMSFNSGTHTLHANPPSNYAGTINLTIIAASGGAKSSDSFSLVVTPINDAPSDLLLTANTVRENSAPGTIIGRLSGFDIDSDTFDFSLPDSANGRFAVQNGQLIVADGVKLDYEQATSYRIVVRSSDSAGLSIDRTFSINLRDVAGERVTGTGGSDVIKGGRGNDQLSGIAGNDKLYGGIGNDQLRGGSGRDVFVFDTKHNKTTNVDRLYDFSVKDDAIWLDNKVFAELGKGSPNGMRIKADMFVKSAKAQNRDDRIIYDHREGTVYYDTDGTGPQAQVKIAILSKNLKVTYHDFFVI
jgi:aryl-phospho-beta-D-glucosidase BglC (GH1 family)